MLLNYIRVAFRNIQRSLSHTVINVLGLTLGITCAVLIYLLVTYHLSFDNFHSESGRIYRFVTEQHRDQVSYVASVPPAFANAFRNDYTFGEKLARICRQEGELISVDINNETKKFIDPVAFVDAAYFEIFNFPLASGTTASLPVAPYTAVLTQNMATKYFGSASAIGKTIRLDNRLEFQITGILQNIPENTDFRTEVFLSYSTMKEYNEWYAADDSWGGITSQIQTFTRLRPGVNPSDVEKVLPAYVKKYRAESKNVHHYHLQPLADVHFNPLYDGQMSIRTIWILSVVGFFLIFTACLNFINLSTARAVTRAKEVGVRKVLGSFRTQLFWQFTIETFVIVAVASTLALGAASAILPQLNTLLKLRIAADVTSHPDLFVFMAALLAAVTFLAGAYPGIVLSGFKPVVALKGKALDIGSRGVNLRRSLIVTQFTITQVLVIGLIVLMYQMKFNSETDMGFRQDGIIMVPAGAEEKMSTLKNEVSKLADVEQVSFCFAAPASFNHWGTSIIFDNRTESEDFGVSFRGADEDYLSTFELELVAGRNVTASDSAREFVVNEEMVKRLNLSPDNALGRTIQFNGDIVGPIVGVVSNFHDRSFRSAISPIMITTKKDSYNDMAVRMRMNDPKATIAAIEKVWTAIYPEQIFHYEFVTEQTAQFYEAEQMVLKLVKTFAFIALLIGCMGLYGLASFMSVQKTKEIGIRKVLGATTTHILSLFGREFVILTLISFAVAAPLGAWIMVQWLAQYEFAVDLTFWIFALELAFVLVIVLLTTGMQSLKAALKNPVTALRVE
ncbi:MAG TPA: ABC transporter permease [Chryseolinea sp.]|nr:ABC transporter permease [Chryseolinea sp.]